LAFEAASGVDFKDISPPLVCIPNDIHSPEVKAEMIDCQLRLLDYRRVGINIVADKDKAISMVTNLPVRVFNFSVPRFSLDCNYFVSKTIFEIHSCKITFTNLTDMDSILVLLAYILYVERSVHQIDPAISDDNASAGMTSKNSTTYNRKRIVRNLLSSHPISGQTTMVSEGSERREFITGVPYTTNGIETRMRTIAAAPINDSISCRITITTPFCTEDTPSKCVSKCSG